MHHFAKDGARRLTGRLSPIALPAPYSTRCIPLIASRALSTRNKVNDKDATESPCSFRRHGLPRAIRSAQSKHVAGRGREEREREKREEKKNRVELSGPESKSRGGLTGRAVDRDRNDRRSIALRTGRTGTAPRRAAAGKNLSSRWRALSIPSAETHFGWLQ